MTQSARRALTTTGRVSGKRFGLDDAHVVVLIICEAYAILVGVRESSVVLAHVVIRVTVVIEVRVVLVTITTVRLRLSPIASEEEFDIRTHLEKLDIAGKTIPGQVAIVKGLLHEGSGPKINVVDDMMEGRGIGDRQMDDGMRACGGWEDAWKPWR